MDMPKKIYASKCEMTPNHYLCGDTKSVIEEDETEYIRADLVNELIESSREFLDQPNFNSASASKSARLLQAAIHKIKALGAE